jgi:hypothetical protein
MIPNSKRIEEIQKELDKLYDITKNVDLRNTKLFVLKDCFDKIYSLEYELECITDIE